MADTYGRWTIIGEGTSRTYGRKIKRFMRCRCTCGTVREVQWMALKHRRSLSCGCLALEVNTTHGQTRGHAQSSEYHTWAAMKDRCVNPRASEYRNYGRRGITVCKRWMVFAAFFEDMGRRPSPRHSIDRIDNNAGYSKESCRWALPVQQVNNSRHVREITVGTATMNIAAWARYLGLNPESLRKRLSKAPTIDMALRPPSVEAQRHGRLGAQKRWLGDQR